MTHHDHPKTGPKRGPGTRSRNGRGAHPWPAEKIPEPGYAYLATALPTPSTPQGPTRRVCWRCVRPLEASHDGHTSVLREEKPPDPAEQCPRCERSFGKRPAAP
jgi:hypothetical protein